MKQRMTLLAAAAAVVVAAVIGYIAFTGAHAPRPTADPSSASVTESYSVAATGDTASGDDSRGAPSLVATRSASPSSSKKSQAAAADENDSSSGPASAGSKDGSSAVVAGLTLAQRKACYYELIQAEDLAVSKAEEAYPLDRADKETADAHMKMRFGLIDEYRTALCKKYGLTPQGLDSIRDEGIRGAWPMPPLDS